MSALLTGRRPARRSRDASSARQQRLPGLGGGGGAPAAPVRRPEALPAQAPAPERAESIDLITTPAPVPEAAGAHGHGPTLDDAISSAWEGLLAGAPTACLVCGDSMQPRHSAGAGVVGGRCGGCDSLLG